tara:strand:- start:772 stop:1074 length:303 start_codon:yes stop_codon:yes gene_type:complete
MSEYIEIEYIGSDGQALYTGVGAEGENDEESRSLFERAQRHRCGDREAEYICDLRSDTGDIIDTVLLTGAGYRAVTGEAEKDEADYRAIEHAERQKSVAA